MAEGKRGTKDDANTEAFQMRAQWKKAEICRLLWHERWNWLLEEQRLAFEESQKIRKQHEFVSAKPKPKLREISTLKPVPLTSTGFIGWLASKPECALEIYTSWLQKPPVRLPDAWDYKHYVQIKK